MFRVSSPPLPALCKRGCGFDERIEFMSGVLRVGASLIGALLLASSVMAADRDNRDERGGRGEARPAAQVERHEGPRGYQRPTEPKGWNVRPQAVNRGEYQHNFQASRSFRIGPYHPPAGWMPRRWIFGQILPRPYWTSEYLIADYWLFGLEVPPPGYEWVRDGADAIMVSTVNGEILQVEYGVFA